MNELLKNSFAARVSANAGTIANVAGRTALTVGRPTTGGTTGRYRITAGGLAFFAASASPIGGSVLRSVSISGLNSAEMIIEWRNSSGTLVDTDFSVVGELF